MRAPRDPARVLALAALLITAPAFAAPAFAQTRAAASVMALPLGVSESSGADAAPIEFAPAPACASDAPLALWPLETPQIFTRVSSGKTPHSGRTPLSAERARVMLQSLTIPGWGQYTVGRHGAAKVFFLIDVGIWSSFVAFQVQEHLRTES
jgi:hypothetical protein